MPYRNKPKKEEQTSVVVKRLEELRKKHNESQEELAKAIGVSPHMIQNVEQEKSNLSLEIASLIATHYKTTIDYLSGRTPDMEDTGKIFEAIHQYIHLTIRSMGTTKNEYRYKVPFISIQKDLFNYLNVLVKAEELESDDVPHEVVEAWVEKRISSLTASLNDTKTDTVEYAMLPESGILSSEIMKLLEQDYENSTKQILRLSRAEDEPKEEK